MERHVRGKASFSQKWKVIRVDNHALDKSRPEGSLKSLIVDCPPRDSLKTDGASKIASNHKPYVDL